MDHEALWAVIEDEICAAEVALDTCIDAALYATKQGDWRGAKLWRKTAQLAIRDRMAWELCHVVVWGIA